MPVPYGTNLIDQRLALRYDKKIKYSIHTIIYRRGFITCLKSSLRKRKKSLELF